MTGARGRLQRWGREYGLQRRKGNVRARFQHPPERALPKREAQVRGNGKSGYLYTNISGLISLVSLAELSPKAALVTTDRRHFQTCRGPRNRALKLILPE